MTKRVFGKQQSVSDSSLSLSRMLPPGKRTGSTRVSFFDAQNTARRHTYWLVVLFSLAVISIILAGTAVFIIVSNPFLDPTITNEKYLDINIIIHYRDLVIKTAIFFASVILLGTVLMLLKLAAGGKVVAEALGGTLVPRNTQAESTKQLLNIVDEIAIASSVPSPPVYILEESGINAFAAGWTVRDAVIGVTRGAVQGLSRDEIQGVIAHEFSHIQNGDMRLNMRLLGVQHGILIIGIIAIACLMLAIGIMSAKAKGWGKLILFFIGLWILVLALSILVVGVAGLFFGSLIRAIVNRQREFLADAAAVQFTRNPAGLANALRRIAQLECGGAMTSRAAPRYCHAFFANGVHSGWSQLFSTHPPLTERIRRLEGWGA